MDNIKKIVHKLKTDPDLFQAMWEGLKTFEFRFNDRNFKTGDWLCLLETKYSSSQMKGCPGTSLIGEPLEYTGRAIVGRIKYILESIHFLLPYGWVIMSLDILQIVEKTDVRPIQLMGNDDTDSPPGPPDLSDIEKKLKPFFNA